MTGPWPSSPPRRTSAASAANAAIDQLHDWIFGTHGRWVSMAVPSDGSYGIPVGMMCGVPVICENGGYRRVGGLKLDAFAQSMLDRTVAELATRWRRSRIS